MINERTLLERFNDDKPSLEAWAQFVVDYVTEEVNKLSGISTQVLSFSPKIRLKDDTSFIEKALYRRKAYKDPYNEIEDKVGIRFIMLVPQYIDIIKKILHDCDSFLCSDDKDWRNDQIAYPFVFDYQSLHIVLRNNNELVYNNITIQSNTPCEVQIRTILQHSFAEFSHFTLYKPLKSIEPTEQRMLARSIALVEAVDSYYETLMDNIIAENRLNWELYNQSTSLYRKFFSSKQVVKKSYCVSVISALQELLSDIPNESFETYLVEKKTTIEYIENHYPNTFLFSQPVIVYILFLISNDSLRFINHWPSTKDDIKPAFTVLGESLPD